MDEDRRITVANNLSRRCVEMIINDLLEEYDPATEPKLIAGTALMLGSYIPLNLINWLCGRMTLSDFSHEDAVKHSMEKIIEDMREIYQELSKKEQFN